MSVRTRAKPNNDLQLDLFAPNALRIPAYEPTNSIWPPGRKTLAEVSSENGRGPGSEGPVAPDVAGGGGEDGVRNGRASPTLDPAGIDTAAGSRPSLGDCPGALLERWAEGDEALADNW